VLFAAAAKGADRLIKIVGDVDEIASNHALAQLFSAIIEPMNPDLVLTGVQAHNDLDGSLGPLLAETMEKPYIGYVAGVTQENGQCVTRKEYPGGLIAEMEVQLPAVLGIQAADEPPRYVAISKIRQAMKTVDIETHEITDSDLSGLPSITRMFQPETGERATMIEGDVDTIATELIGIFKEHGVL
jgi:electron transfer flavoprotein beta subunit